MAAPRVFTKEENDEIVRLGRAGVPFREIVEKFGHRQVIYDTWRREGVSRKRIGGPPRLVHQAEIDEILRLWAEGDAIGAIAKKLGRSRDPVLRVLRTAGIEPTARPSRAAVGQRVVHSSGYILVHIADDDPHADMRQITWGMVLEHRLVMARALGRSLDSWETVHHINGDRRDNRIGNLQLHSGRHGQGVARSCLDCGSHNVKDVELHRVGATRSD